MSVIIARLDEMGALFAYYSQNFRDKRLPAEPIGIGECQLDGSIVIGIPKRGCFSCRVYDNVRCPDDIILIQESGTQYTLKHDLSKRPKIQVIDKRRISGELEIGKIRVSPNLYFVASSWFSSALRGFDHPDFLKSVNPNLLELARAMNRASYTDDEEMTIGDETTMGEYFIREKVPSED